MSVEIEAEGLAQLHRWQLWAHEHSKTIKLSATLSDRLLLAFTSKPVKVSRPQRSATRLLRMRCHEMQQETSTQCDYSLDALASLGGRDVAIEVDGPPHFLWIASQQEQPSRRGTNYAERLD